MNKNIWNACSEEQMNWVILFKNIFIDQRKNDLELIFSNDFGYHNGFTKEEYAQYEFDEFDMKCASFGLTHQCEIQCFSLADNYFYFSLGKKNDKAVFEAIFIWNEKEKKAKGNGYLFKIEPKIQFIKIKDTLQFKRRINLTPQENVKIKTLTVNAENNDFYIIKNELAPHLGGNFYSAVYDYSEDNLMSYWDDIVIYSSDGPIKAPILMRGVDHPLFIDNLFPKLSKHEVQCPNGIYPVVLYILLDNGEEYYYKYPKEKCWKFDSPIKKVCLTDPLSFDWIVEN